MICTPGFLRYCQRDEGSQIDQLIARGFVLELRRWACSNAWAFARRHVAAARY